MLQFVKSLTRPQKRIILLSIDLALVPIALLFAIAVQTGEANSFIALLGSWRAVLILMIAAVVLSVQLGIHKIRLHAFENRAIGKTALFAYFMSLTAIAIGQMVQPPLSIKVYIVFGISFFLLSAASRIVMQQVLLRIYRHAHIQSRVLIYGAGTTGMQLASALKNHETIDLVAFVDDNMALQGMTVSGLQVLSPLQIADIIADRNIDRVILAMPSLSPPKLSRLARRLENLGAEVQSLPSFAQLTGEEELVDRLSPVSPDLLLGRAQVIQENPQFGTTYSGKTVLISGAGGSIGSELSRQVLACRPHRLILLDHSEPALYAIDQELRGLAGRNEPNIIPVLGSVLNQKQIQSLFMDHQVDVVLHAAAYKHVPLVESNALVGLSNNVLGTANLAKEALAAGVTRFILVSSDKAVRPTNVMGASKRLAEMVIQDLAARSRKTIFSMVRFGNVLGSSGSVIPLFQDQISRGGPVTLTHQEVTRYFMTIQEAARLVLLAGSFAKGGEVFVLDMGKPVEIRQLARQAIEAQGYTVRDADNPAGDIEIVTTGLRPGEKLFEELLIDESDTSTANNKIFCTREPCLSEIEMAAAIRALQDAAFEGNELAAQNVVRRWVDGYIPANHIPPVRSFGLKG